MGSSLRACHFAGAGGAGHELGPTLIAGTELFRKAAFDATAQAGEIAQDGTMSIHTTGAARAQVVVGPTAAAVQQTIVADQRGGGGATIPKRGKARAHGRVDQGFCARCARCAECSRRAGCVRDCGSRAGLRVVGRVERSAGSASRNRAQPHEQRAKRPHRRIRAHHCRYPERRSCPARWLSAA